MHINPIISWTWRSAHTKVQSKSNPTYMRPLTTLEMRIYLITSTWLRVIARKVEHQCDHLYSKYESLVISISMVAIIWSSILSYGSIILLKVILTFDISCYYSSAFCWLSIYCYWCSSASCNNLKTNLKYFSSLFAEGEEVFSIGLECFGRIEVSLRSVVLLNMCSSNIAICSHHSHQITKAINNR